MIEFITEDISAISFNSKSIINWIENIVNQEDKIVGDLCFILCSDKYLLNINQQYLQHDYFTDIITFDYSDKNIISGDIFISVDRVTENSENLNIPFQKEFLRIVIHGILHLLGYDDKSEFDKNLMTSKEDACLKLYSDVG